ANDRVCQPVEGLPIGMNHAAVFTADALCGELDRRQRILDLVRNPAGNVAPGGRALRGDQLGDVVEGDDAALIALLRMSLLLGHLDCEDALLISDRHGDLAMRAVPALQLLGRLRAMLAESRNSFGKRPAKKIIGLDAKQALSRRIRYADDPGSVETDDARADAGQHRLHEAAALVELIVDGNEGTALA